MGRIGRRRAVAVAGAVLTALTIGGGAEPQAKGTEVTQGMTIAGIDADVAERAGLQVVYHAAGKNCERS